MKCPEYIWVVIPVYNNAATLKQVADGALKHCDRVLVVDDGSTDADVRELLSGTAARVITHQINRGKGCALKTGFDHVIENGGGYVVTLDADGQHDPEDILLFLPHISEGGRKIILGSRDFASASIPEKSKFGRKFSNFWIKLQTGREVLDSQSGFRAYPAELLKNVRCISAHYDFETEILVRGIWAGFDTLCINISVFYPEKDKRVSHFRTFRDNLRISLLHSRLCCEKMLPFFFGQAKS